MKSGSFIEKSRIHTLKQTFFKSKNSFKWEFKTVGEIDIFLFDNFVQAHFQACGRSYIISFENNR